MKMHEDRLWPLKTLCGSIGIAYAYASWATLATAMSEPVCTSNATLFDEKEDGSSRIVFHLFYLQAVFLVMMFYLIVATDVGLRNVRIRDAGASEMATEGQKVGGSGGNTVKVSVPLRFSLGPCLGHLLTDHGFVRQEQVRRSRGMAFWGLEVSGNYCRMIREHT